jgi:hypothetical protein
MRDVFREVEKTKELAAKWGVLSVDATKAEEKRDAYLFRLLEDLDWLRAKVRRLSRSVQRNVLGEDPGWGRNEELIRLLLKKACPELDAKKRAKYAAVLRYVAAQKKPGEAVKDFVRKNGGINGCDTKERKLRRQAARRSQT